MSHRVVITGIGMISPLGLDTAATWKALLAGTSVEGIAHNVGFLARVVEHPAFRAGEVFTGFIDAWKADLLG